VVFAGAADEIVPAFSVHAASAHGQIVDEDLAARLASGTWHSAHRMLTLRDALSLLANPADTGRPDGSRHRPGFAGPA
jgi:hypothetical protein